MESFGKIAYVSALLLHVKNAMHPQISGGSSSPGVTSVIASPERYLAGAKNGKIFVRDYPLDKTFPLSFWREMDGSADSKPVYPVYSLSYYCEADSGVELLFSGGGDRYARVYGALATENAREGGSKERETLVPLQRLGPHTGWVKDVLYDAERRRLYSIGCNCVEVWGPKETEGLKSFAFHHQGKRTIENSPDEGSTLSSDLLCLALKVSGAACLHPPALLAGGVDGRLHCWEDPDDDRSSHFAKRVHNGRVNVLLYTPAAQLVFSAGHDGRLVVCCVRDDSFIEPVAELNISNDCDSGDQNPARVLAGTCLYDSAGDVYLALGTNVGSIVVVRALLDAACGRADLSTIGILHVPSEPTIHALDSTSVAHGGQFLLLAGHANGLSEITVTIENDAVTC